MYYYLLSNLLSQLSYGGAIEDKKLLGDHRRYTYRDKLWRGHIKKAKKVIVGLKKIEDIYRTKPHN